MKILLEIKDTKVDFVMELLNSLAYVKAKPIARPTSRLGKEIAEVVEEMKLIRAGKKKANNAEDFLNGL